jgi:hypothetical protein
VASAQAIAPASFAARSIRRTVRFTATAVPIEEEPSMLVEVAVPIQAAASTVWALIADIDNAAAVVRGIDRIEVLHRPAAGLVGLKWRETRQLFGKAASADKWITEAREPQCYATRAESDGFVFLSTLRIEADGNGAGVILRSIHDSQPQTLGAKIMALPMGLFFKGVAKKALLADLHDIRKAAESPAALRQALPGSTD